MIDPTPEQLAVFTQEYCRHIDQPDAAVIAVTRAGLRDPMWPPQIVAERYLARDDVQAMVSVLKQVFKPRETTEVTTQTLSEAAEEIAQNALRDRQYQPAIAARKFQAELHGLLTQKIEHTHKVTVKTLTDEQLEKIAAGGIIEGEFKQLPAVDATT